MSIISGRDLGLKLCEAFGLDPHGISSIAIEAKCGEIATVTIVKAFKERDADGARDVVKSFGGLKAFKVLDA